jgi:hypothetical protein
VKEETKEKLIEKLPGHLQVLLKRAKDLGIDLLERFETHGN